MPPICISVPALVDYNPPPPPDCEASFEAHKVSFVEKNWAGATLLGNTSAIDPTIILGWSALESKYGVGGIAPRNNNFFGWGGRGDVACPPTANRNFGCFSSWFASGETALFSANNYFHYENLPSRVPAAYIIKSELDKGSSIEQTFDVLSKAGYTPNKGYGEGVLGGTNKVRSILGCLRSKGKL